MSFQSPNVEKGGLAQVGIESKLSDLSKERFKENMVDVLKESLILFFITYLFKKEIDENNIDAQEFKQRFFSLWREGVNKAAQEHLFAINKTLNDNNMDLLNIIQNDNSLLTDTEECQESINAAIREVDGIFWSALGGKG